MKALRGMVTAGMCLVLAAAMQAQKTGQRPSPGRPGTDAASGSAASAERAWNVAGAVIDMLQPETSEREVLVAIEGRTEAGPASQAARGGLATAPASRIDRRSAAQIAAQIKTLTEQAKASASGSASVTLERYPGHMTMLTVRTKSGGGELHRDWNDLFIVLDGEATEVTGGTIVDGREQAPGEIRGSTLENGAETPMRKGDFIHIPPNTPHQTLLAPGATFTYYVVKIAAQKS